MFKRQQLDQLIKHLHIDITDIPRLQEAIITFHANYIDPNIDSLPFPEYRNKNQYTPPQYSAIEAISKLRNIASSFNHHFYSSLELSSPDADDKDRAKFFSKHIS